jgi:hypothetical protein
MNKLFEQTKKFATWLDNRDYFVKRDIDRIIEKYEAEVEQARIYAVQNLLNRLSQIRESAKSEMNDKSTSAKYRRLATTEFKRVTEEMVKLEATISYEESTLSTGWNKQ